MQNETLLYIVFAFAVSFVIAFFLYGFRSKLPIRQRWIFGVLRFLSIFLLLLLLINPKIRNFTFESVKSKLLVVVDNSKSISYLDNKNNIEKLIADFKENERLNNRFDLVFYNFGNSLQPLDSVSLDENHTRISEALLTLNEVYKNQVAPIVIATDGNQTLGTDYQFIKDRLQQSVYPVVLGDTIQHSDLYISQINANRYAYLKNDFPVEIFVGYSGEESVNQELTITQGNTVVYSKNLAFNPEQKVHQVQFTLPANHTGVQRYTARIASLDGEKNTENNQRYFAVEVIDQATNILIVSDITHPDLGAFQKSISSNEQRKVFFSTPDKALNSIDNVQLLVLYQPNSKFQSVLEYVQQAKLNTLVVTGVNTDWNFLNRVQPFFKKNAHNREFVQGFLNSGYSVFQVDDIGFSGFPPLETSLGTLTFSISYQTLLEQSIHSITTDSPLATTFEVEGLKMGVLDGEGWWRWRAATYVKNKNFKPFDDFVSGVVQYLASARQRTRLEVFSESFYYNSNDVKITAQFFDQNFVFNNNAFLQIVVKNQESGEQFSYPFLLRNNYYEVNLSHLPEGEYTYTVSVKDENLSRSGQFSIVAYEVERQFVNADIQRLQALAGSNLLNTANSYTRLIDKLLENEDFMPVQKSNEKTVPLVDWKWLLFLLTGVLALEWFLRKYNGLV